ncbi:hypothetical protein BOVATA_004680 [Babesia ovata]|uniref:Uncharacterized protein n=1 Tax=Babesia ovata TaxID=189622 RepID=A0A2H6K7K7_9APIC|nr:uncharacterized protein BOVATA_004680 [Babesia ovata]GBE58975.1 hypothetical protein BOVATA_004680 [Babesia ovata]
MARYGGPYKRTSSPFVHSHRCDYVVDADRRKVYYRASSVSPPPPAAYKPRLKNVSAIDSWEAFENALDAYGKGGLGGIGDECDAATAASARSVEPSKDFSYYDYDKHISYEHEDNTYDSIWADDYVGDPPHVTLEKVEPRSLLGMLGSGLNRADYIWIPGSAVTQLQTTVTGHSPCQAEDFQEAIDTHASRMTYVEPQLELLPRVTAPAVRDTHEDVGLSPTQHADENDKPKRSPVRSLFGAMRNLRRRANSISQDSAISGDTSQGTIHRSGSRLGERLRQRDLGVRGKSDDATPSGDTTQRTGRNVVHLEDVDASAAELLRGVIPGTTPARQSHAAASAKTPRPKDDVPPPFAIPKSILRKIVPKEFNIDDPHKSKLAEKVEESDVTREAARRPTSPPALTEALEADVMPIEAGRVHNMFRMRYDIRHARDHKVRVIGSEKSEDAAGSTLGPLRDAVGEGRQLSRLFKKLHKRDLSSEKVPSMSLDMPAFVMASKAAALAVESTEQEQGQDEEMPSNIEISRMISSKAIGQGDAEFGRKMTMLCSLAEDRDDLIEDSDGEHLASGDVSPVYDDLIRPVDIPAPKSIAAELIEASDAGSVRSGRAAIEGAGTLRDTLESAPLIKPPSLWIRSRESGIIEEIMMPRSMRDPFSVIKPDEAPLLSPKCSRVSVKAASESGSELPTKISLSAVSVSRAPSLQYAAGSLRTSITGGSQHDESVHSGTTSPPIETDEHVPWGAPVVDTPIDKPSSRSVSSVTPPVVESEMDIADVDVPLSSRTSSKQPSIPSSRKSSVPPSVAESDSARSASEASAPIARQDVPVVPAYQRIWRLYTHQPGKMSTAGSILRGYTDSALRAAGSRPRPETADLLSEYVARTRPEAREDEQPSESEATSRVASIEKSDSLSRGPSLRPSSEDYGDSPDDMTEAPGGDLLSPREPSSEDQPTSTSESEAVSRLGSKALSETPLEPVTEEDAPESEHEDEILDKPEETADVEPLAEEEAPKSDHEDENLDEPDEPVVEEEAPKSEHEDEILDTPEELADVEPVVEEEAPKSEHEDDMLDKPEEPVKVEPEVEEDVGAPTDVPPTQDDEPALPEKQAEESDSEGKKKKKKKKKKKHKKEKIDNIEDRPRPLRHLVDKQLKDGFSATVYIVTSKKNAISTLCTVKFDYEKDRLILETPANVFDIDASKVVAEEIPTLPGAPVLLKLTVYGKRSSAIVIQSTSERNLDVLGGTVGWVNAIPHAGQAVEAEFDNALQGARIGDPNHMSDAMIVTRQHSVDALMPKNAGQRPSQDGGSSVQKRKQSSHTSTDSAESLGGKPSFFRKVTSPTSQPEDAGTQKRGLLSRILLRKRINKESR